MTKIITRYFDSADGARATKREMVQHERVSPRIVRIYDSADGLVDHLTAAEVEKATAEAYAKRLEKGGAVMLVEAGAKPLGIARITRELTASMGGAAIDDLVEEVEVKDRVRLRQSILSDHPLILTRWRDPDKTDYYMADWPLPLISRRKPFKGSVIPRHGRMASWPIGLLLPGHVRYGRFPFDFLIPGHKHMANFPIPLLSDRKPYDEFAFPRHKRMADFPIPLISRRKPYNRTAIGRHTRMANWPFPLLINGKQHTNALIPGQPHMADAPLPLLSDREPADKFAFPRHARMANFPIPLISRRKPYDEFAFPRHKRMADFPIPLLTKRVDPGSSGRTQRFSLSNLLGLRTVIRR